MGKQEDICVIIPTMNRPENLNITLKSYFEGEVFPSQMVIIDQSEKENVREENKRIVSFYRRYGKRIDYYFQQTPSLTKARNIGIDLCKCNIIVGSDDDITVQKDTLKNILEIMKDKKTSMIAGIDLNMKNSTSKLGVLFFKKSLKNRNIGHVTSAMLGRFPEKMSAEEVPTQWAMGFFFVVRYDLLKKWGISWDEKLTSYAYAEDLDFSYSYYKRSKEEKLRCILSKRVEVYHRASQEWRVSSKKSTRMYVLNREYLSYKHKMGIKSRIAMRWCNFGDFILRILQKNAPIDILTSQLRCDIHRKELRNGQINPDWYK